MACREDRRRCGVLIRVQHAHRDRIAARLSERRGEDLNDPEAERDLGYFAQRRFDSVVHRVSHLEIKACPARGETGRFSVFASVGVRSFAIVFENLARSGVDSDLLAVSAALDVERIAQPAAAVLTL